MLCTSIFVLLLVVGIAMGLVPNLVKSQACPKSCQCLEELDLTLEIICSVASSLQWQSLCQEINEYTRHTDRNIKLKLTGDWSTAQYNLICLPKIKALDLSHTFLQPRPEMFTHLGSLSMLNLSYNDMHDLPINTFIGLMALTELDISHNRLTKLESTVLHDVPLLTTLDVSYNKLISISNETFSNSPNLQEINFEKNVFQEFSAAHMQKCVTLKKLNLSKNLLKTFFVPSNESEMSVIQGLSYLDLSSNPLDCSCMLGKILSKMWASIVAAEKTLCDTPAVLQGKSIISVKLKDMTCTLPNSILVLPANETSLLTTSSVIFRCSAKGYPTPNIMWTTPWGDVFYNGNRGALEHSNVLPLEQATYTYREYEEPNVDISTTIQIDSKNNLIISKFRGSMVGEYVCLAFNEAGNFSSYITVSVFSKLKPIMIQSLFIGGYCASGFLIIGLLTGLVRAVVKKMRHTLYFIVPQFSKAGSHHQTDNISCTLSIESSKNFVSQGGLEQCGGLMTVAEDVENNCDADACDQSKGSNSPKEWRPKAILDYLEDSRGKLRNGVGRKMQRVRKNVQHIKESSSVYMHNIVETGSYAARSMRAGVVMGVETVKYHVQSFKELCGTGDMGTQTISMISVETDVDSYQSKDVIKQMTFV